MRKAISLVFVLLITFFSGVVTKKAVAGQDEFIAPLFSGYVEDEKSATLISQDTLIDMSKYNGVETVGQDVGRITATSRYTVSATQAGAIFCVPYLGTGEQFEQLQITLNGTNAQTEILYGETPSYFAGKGQGAVSVVEAIESVQPATLKNEIGKLYTLETTGGEIEFSFEKDATQTVIHGGVSWSRQSANTYSFKVRNSTLEAYPYRIFVSDGELSTFATNVKYTICDISYKNYVDYCLQETGQELQPYFYSKFNRCLSGKVWGIEEVLLYYPRYVFVLAKISLPLGVSEIVVKSACAPLINALYEPYVYVMRTVSPYPQSCAYSLEIKLSQTLPYVVEDNIQLSHMKHGAQKQSEDGYFVVSAKGQIKNILTKNNAKIARGGLVVVTSLVFCIVILFCVCFSKSSRWRR